MRPEDAAWTCKDVSVLYFGPEDSPLPNSGGFALYASKSEHGQCAPRFICLT